MSLMIFTLEMSTILKAVRQTFFTRLPLSKVDKSFYVENWNEEICTQITQADGKLY